LLNARDTGLDRLSGLPDQDVLVANREHETGQALNRAYEDIVTERDRLRDARGAITRQLGPLPASAAIAISLVGALTEKASAIALGVAVGLFGALVGVSIVYSVLPPYRKLRAKYEDGEKPHELGFDEHARATDWLEHMIGLERRIYGSLDANRANFRLPFGIENLQDSFDAERTGLFIVQALFVLVIATLVVGVLVGR
jgi:hypothetical protein